ncbi:MAG: Polyketide cyclase / dehydrase and lipid transport [Solirubrobacteraceae bacterium]|nr:Polyketide cyclase / dehydrase and lipid transport [Solirubrobacteraceae bacterium]
MKDLRGSASQPVNAAPERCLELLADVEGYPRWYPEVVRGIEVVKRDAAGAAQQVRAILRAAVGPINRDLELQLGVTRGADTVVLARVPDAGSDRERFEVNWRVVRAGAQQARIELSLAASLDVPRLLPVSGLADTLATGFVGAAVRELSRGT